MLIFFFFPLCMLCDYSFGQFFEDARKISGDILGRDHVPKVAGGTGISENGMCTAN